MGTEAFLSLPYWVAVYALAAAVIDLVSRRIPNALTYSGIVVGLLVGLWPGVGPNLTDSLLGIAAVFVPSLLLFAIGSMGGGDVKLLTAIGALVGYPVILDVMFYAIVFGCVWGLAVIIWRGRVLDTLKGFWSLLLSLFYPGTYKIVPVQDLSVPFGVPIAAGTVWTIFDLSHVLAKLMSG